MVKKEKEQIQVSNSHSVPGLELGILHHSSQHPLGDRSNSSHSTDRMKGRKYQHSFQASPSTCLEFPHATSDRYLTFLILIYEL